MLHRACWRVAVVGSFLAVAGAQQTWVVDAGYQGNLRTLQEAVNLASDGDIILIRYASGLPIDWTLTLNKSVAIVGDNGNPRAGVVGNLTIQGLQAHQRVVLRSLEPDPNNGTGTAQLTIQNCQGEVVLDDVRLSSETAFSGSLGTGLTVQNSAHVALHRSSVIGGPAVAVGGSALTLTDTSVAGRTGARFLGSSFPGIEATGSRLWVSGGAIRGGGGIDVWAGPSRPGLILRGSAAQVAGTVLDGGSFLRPEAAVDLDAASNLVHDAATTIVTWISGSTANVAAAETGRISGGLAAASQPAVFSIDAAAGTFALLLLSLPGPEVMTPFGSGVVVCADGGRPGRWLGAGIGYRDIAAGRSTGHRDRGAGADSRARSVALVGAAIVCGPVASQDGRGMIEVPVDVAAGGYAWFVFADR
ncbi:MAG: hypothetical protein IPK26_15665 [Planctomycetes bacterium]|nr:hypothetical protein [Planctomycetota bacterium]